MFGGLDFANHFVLLGRSRTASTATRPAMRTSRRPAGRVGWGQFVTVLINFLILAFVIFLLVRYANRLAGRSDEPAGPSEVDLLTEIRDELSRRG